MMEQNPPQGPTSPSTAGAAAPPAPGQYPYPYPYPPRRRSMFGAAVRFFGFLIVLVGAAITCFMFGIYAGIFSMAMNGGVASSTYHQGSDTQRIAIIPVVGLIDGSTADFVHDAVAKAIEDERVGAVVLRVDSPGGFAGPSDQIWNEIKRLKASGKYVVASYGTVAASGGYYVSCGSDKIYAEPITITGSIGVIASVFTFEQLLDHIGIKPEVITATTSPDKGTANNIFRSWNEADRAAIRDRIDAMHERFTAVVIEGRKGVLTADEARALCTGKAFIADEAIQNKLIDGLGYLDDAIAAAKNGASLTDPTVIEYRMQPGLPSMIGMSEHPKGGLPRSGTEARQWLVEMSVPQVMFLMHP